MENETINKRLERAIYAIGASRNTNTEEAWNKVNKCIRRHRLRSLSCAAAAIVVFSLGAAIRLFTSQPVPPPSLLSSIPTIPPPQQIVLTLSTGQQIILSDSLSPLTEANGTTIQNVEKQLVYNPTDTTAVPVYNTITIPRGCEYKLVLADNSTVWLNSESRLTYPVAFKGDTRELTLEGEAFFEVTKDEARPFIVHTSKFDIRVTGTQFNVRTYPEETESTTLTEGSIQLEKDQRVYRLIPGQQAYLDGKEVKVKEVNPEDAVAWRFNAFSFKEEPLEYIMNELSRWYDIDIFYTDPKVKALHFTAWFRRSTPIKELLSILEKTQQIKLELKDKTVIVTKQR